MEMSFSSLAFKVYFKVLCEGFGKQVATMGSVVSPPPQKIISYLKAGSLQR